MPVRGGLRRALVAWGAAAVVVTLVAPARPGVAEEGRYGPDQRTTRSQEPGQRGLTDPASSGLDELSLLQQAARAERRRLAQPTTSGFLPPPVKCRLESAFALAFQLIDGRTRCEALFAPLGQRGTDAIQRMVFFSAANGGPCRTGAPAFNYFGRPLTGVCDAFGRLDLQEAAVQVIHEALHVAGMNEYPNDPQGLTPHEISALVRTACLK